MSFRDNLRTVIIDGKKYIGASFRGVPFFVDAVQRSGGGRRATVHEFYGRNEPFVDDNGGQAVSFHIDGHVLGPDYIAKKNALLAALNVEGPGQLVHPYEGVKRAICVGCNVSESAKDGGIATFSLDFAEAPTQAPAPSQVADLPAQVSDAADEAITATETELVEQFDAEGLPAYALESAETALANATEGLEAKLAPLIEDTQELAEFTGRIRLLTAEASSLVREPAEAIGGFRDAIVGLLETIKAAPGDVMAALFEAYLVDLGTTVVATTATREQELANQTALTAGLRRIMLIEACRLAAVTAYTSDEDALAARDIAIRLLDEQAELATDTAYPSIAALRAAVGRAVPGTQELARVVQVTQITPVPSIVLAYKLYGSTDSEQDIVARNRIAHPGFCVGDLKVLSNG